MRICIPVQAATNEAARLTMDKAFALTEMVELRTDGMKDPDLPGLLEGKKGKILITNRRRDEGGAWADTENKRVRLLEEAVCLGADYVDIEAATDHRLIMNLLARIRDASQNPTPLPQGRGYSLQTKVILSWHDFTATPPERVLRRKFQEMMAMGADIVKMVTYARETADNLRILGLIPYARRQGQEIIALCMGDLGRPSRIMSPLLGSYLTYASLERGAESAPGQLTVDDIKKIWEIMAP
jgi:3-dehydroquinate dehydratase type I